MKLKKTGIFVVLLITLWSCKTSITSYSPYYTEPLKVSQLQKGMNLQQVNDQLGVEPFDVYFAGDDCKIIAYKYRLKYRTYKASIKKRGFNTLESQTGGKEYYDKPNTVYVYFVDNKMTSLISDEGLKESAYIITDNNTLKLISKENLVLYNDRALLYKEGQIWNLDPEKGLEKVDIQTNVNSIFGNKMPKNNIVSNSQNTELSPDSKFYTKEKFLGVALAGIRYDGETEINDESSDPLKMSFTYGKFRFNNNKRLGLYQEYDFNYVKNEFEFEYYNNHYQYEYNQLSMAYFIGPAYKIYNSKDRRFNLNGYLGVGAFASRSIERNDQVEWDYTDEDYDLKFAINPGIMASYKLSDNTGISLNGCLGPMSKLQVGLTWSIKKSKN